MRRFDRRKVALRWVVRRWFENVTGVEVRHDREATTEVARRFPIFLADRIFKEFDGLTEKIIIIVYH